MQLKLTLIYWTRMILNFSLQLYRVLPTKDLNCGMCHCTFQFQAFTFGIFLPNLLIMLTTQIVFIWLAYIAWKRLGKVGNISEESNKSIKQQQKVMVKVYR